MKTLEEYQDELQAFCSKGLSFPNDFSVYRNSKHKGIQCTFHNTIHVVSTKEWKAFTRQVSESSILTNKEKSSLLDLSASPLTLRSFYSNLIEATEQYKSLTYLFEKQDETYEEYLNSYVPVQKDNADLFDLGEITNPVLSIEQFMTFNELERFKLLLSLQKEITAHTKHTDPIILAHFSSNMDVRAASLWKKLDIREVFNPQACSEILGIQETILPSSIKDVELLDVTRYITVQFRGSEEKYLVTKYDWKNAQYEMNSNHTFYQIIASSRILQAEELFIERVKENENWKKAESVINNTLQAIEREPKKNLDEYLSYVLDQLGIARKELKQLPQLYENLGVYKLSCDLKRSVKRLHLSKPKSNEIVFTREDLENLLYSEDEEELKVFYSCKRKNAYTKKADTFYPIMINGNGTMEPYQCDECGYWHAGHKPSGIERPSTYYLYQARKYAQYELEKLE